MHRNFMRFLALLALALMPAGMAATPAAAHTAPAVEAGHCNDHNSPAHDSAMPQAHCMACSALAAFEGPGAAAGLLPQPPRELPRMDPIPGIDPETDTPPPKHS